MKRHPTEEEIALFIEERYGEIDEAWICSHLQHCQQCFAEYQNALRWRGVLESQPDAFRSTNNLMYAGMQVTANSKPRRPVWHQSTRGPKKVFGFLTPLRVAAAAMALVVLSTGAVWLNSISNRDESGLPPGLIEPIRAATASVSSRSLIVLPGSEWSFDATRPTYRSASYDESNLLSATLLELVKFYEGKRDFRDALCWLIKGFLAAGILTTANDYAQEAYRLYPGDAEVMTLTALVAYCQGDTRKSEQYLRDVLEKEPDQAVALMDLGIVVADEGRNDEARLIFERIKSSYPGTPLALRAQRLLSKE